MSKVVSLCGSVKTRVDNLERAHIEGRVNLVWEGGINDNTIDVLKVLASKRGLSKLSVFVL